MTDIDAYIAARGRALGCQANGWRREWYRESMKGELTEMTLARRAFISQRCWSSAGTEMTLARRAFSCADESLGRVSALSEIEVNALSEIEEAISGVLAFHQLLGSEPASYDEMLDIAAAESGERVSTLAKALSRAARIWEEGK